MYRHGRIWTLDADRWVIFGEGWNSREGCWFQDERGLIIQHLHVRSLKREGLRLAVSDWESVFPKREVRVESQCRRWCVPWQRKKINQLRVDVTKFVQYGCPGVGGPGKSHRVVFVLGFFSELRREDGSGEYEGFGWWPGIICVGNKSGFCLVPLYMKRYLESF